MNGEQEINDVVLTVDPLHHSNNNSKSLMSPDVSSPFHDLPLELLNFSYGSCISSMDDSHPMIRMTEFDPNSVSLFNLEQNQKFKLGPQHKQILAHLATPSSEIKTFEQIWEDYAEKLNSWKNENAKPFPEREAILKNPLEFLEYELAKHNYFIDRKIKWNQFSKNINISSIPKKTSLPEETVLKLKQIGIMFNWNTNTFSLADHHYVSNTKRIKNDDLFSSEEANWFFPEIQYDAGCIPDIYYPFWGNSYENIKRILPFPNPKLFHDAYMNRVRYQYF